MASGRTLGINGLGRIGKLTLWHHLGAGEYDRFVVNTGREVGTSLESIAHYLSRDSTYGNLHRWLEGNRGKPDCVVVSEKNGLLKMHGKEVQVLREARNPVDIPWRDNGAGVVVDCTGRFLDPHDEPDTPGGALRGHLAAGARVVILSAPFKSRQKNAPDPEDSLMMIYGINHYKFEPGRHTVISAGSCTTTALAHMMRPLLDRDLTRRMITAGMSTIHSVTASQPFLDSVPAAGARDLRKSRSGIASMVITGTGAARALEQVMPEVSRIGFMAESVRIPTATVSLIILNVTFQSGMTADGNPLIDRESINGIYRQASQCEARGLVRYTEEQNVSADLKGEDAAVVIEAAETHTRTGFVDVEIPAEVNGDQQQDQVRTCRIPVTHVKIFGWYDNELGSYTNRLGQLTSHISGVL
ncbi:MAG TPA: glyceraldehyde 3-phosphate dehydrogenase NAD-binding domain-containing protein [Candidatus Sabulitectum sp.]|nr:glyceraldehyde 3-phosphate dehydrogenase NAD-binding domain-containing protein [Candidatus Sabulitectum sp.]